MTLWLRGKAGHAWGLTHTNQHNVLTLPWVQAMLDSAYNPNAPPFVRCPTWHMSPCAGHFAVFCTGSGTRVRGGGDGST